jgi:hypothetical protein
MGVWRVAHIELLYYENNLFEFIFQKIYVISIIKEINKIGNVILK